MREKTLKQLLPKALRSGLTPAENKLVIQAKAGHFLDYQSGNPEVDKLENASKWGRERVLRAELLHWLCTNEEACKLAHNKGIRIVGARIDELLDFDSATLPFPLWIISSCIPAEIILHEASTRTLAIINSQCSSIFASGLKTKGGLFLRGTIIQGEVNLISAEIGGLLSFTKAKLDNPNGNALNADGLKTAGSVFLNDGFEATGEVRLLGAEIGGAFNCNKAKFNNPNGDALSADGLKTAGSVFLNDGFEATGEVRLLGAVIRGTLNCDKAKFSNPNGKALSADGLKTTGSVFLNDGFEATGEVRLVSADIRGALNCDKAKLNNPEGKTLNADGLKTTGNVFLIDGFESTGEVRLLGAEIGGTLNCSNAKLNNPDRDALSADRIKTTGSVFLNKGFESTGEIRLLGAEIGGNLTCAKAKLSNPKGKALSADRIKTTGSVFLRDGFESTGEIRLLGAEIGGNLSCSNAKLSNPEGDVCVFERMQVEGAMFWRKISLDGKLNLMHARVSQLVDHKESWPERNKLFLDGFEYGAFAGGTPLTVEERLEWLRLQPHGKNTFRLHPYEQLAKVFRKMGHESDAVKVLIAKQEDLCKFGKLSHKARLWNLFLGVTIGYGYQPWKAFSFIGMFIFIGWFFFWWAGQMGVMQPSKERVYLDKDYVATKKLPDQYPHFQPLAYSIDVFVPFLDLHQEDYFLPDATKSSSTGWGTRLYFWFHIGLGWIFSSLAVASLTGLIRKE